MINLTDEDFEEKIKNSQKPILVDFYAFWCPPCQVLSPILEKLEKEFEGKVIFAKVNVDLAPKISQKLGIDSIPAVFLFKNGKVISAFVGARPEGEIRKWLNENLKEEKEDMLEILKNLILKQVKEYAQKSGYRLNPDEKMVEKIVEILAKNELKHGFRYCPCRRISGNLEEDRKKICPCFWHKQEIEKMGHCHCQLFFKK